LKRLALVLGLGLLCAADVGSHGAAGQVENSRLNPSGSEAVLHRDMPALTARAADAAGSKNPADATIFAPVRSEFDGEDAPVAAEPVKLSQRDPGGLDDPLQDAFVGKAAAATRAAPDRARTIVLGFDGMDPELTQQSMAEGMLPHFARLAREGHYQVLPTTNPAQSPVAWARTRAFALGLNGTFLNLQGREALGTVRAEDAAELKREIAEKLKDFRDPDTGGAVIAATYDGDEIYAGRQTGDAPDLVTGYARGYRASWQTAVGGVPEPLVEDNTRKWSGDHCIDPVLVPGVLFTSFKPATEVGSIGDVPQLIRSTLGLTGRVKDERTEPSMGAFDLASPALSSIDRLMARWLPAAGRLAFWGIVTAVVSMGLYRLTSNQARLAANKAEVVALRRRLAGFDGPFAELWPLLRRNFALAGRQLWLTLVPAVIASLPVLFILVWVSNAFDARMPEPGDQIEVTTIASAGRELPPLAWQGDGKATTISGGVWQVSWPEKDGSVRLVEADGTVLLTLPTLEPVSVVHQRRWWNALVGNPAGYLPSPGDVDMVELDLPQPEFLPLGPDWLRGWMSFFFAIVIVVSLLLKFLWRLH
jgi:hypothetical protein